MALSIGIDRNTGIMIREAGVEYALPKTALDTIRDSVALRTMLKGVRQKGVSLELHWHVDSDGNRYVITGPLPSLLPDPVRERAEESKQR